MKREGIVFGYLKIEDNQLTADEYALFSAYYCGVCRATGKRASQMSRLGLSYDITFLALVLSSVCDTEIGMEKGRCVRHPIKPNDHISDSRATEYAADVGVMLSYLKLADDWHDSRSIKALFGMALLYRGYRKVRLAHESVFQIIKSQLDILSALEQSGCTSIDETADAFAKILEALFSPQLVSDGASKRALAWLGYNLGRWIYIMDAVCDLEQDVKTGSYNTFAAASITDKAMCADAVEESLTMTLGAIASAFELISFRRNRDMIGRIIYITLKEKQAYILLKEVNSDGPV